MSDQAKMWWALDLAVIGEVIGGLLAALVEGL